MCVHYCNTDLTVYWVKYIDLTLEGAEFTNCLVCFNKCINCMVLLAGLSKMLIKNTGTEGSILPPKYLSIQVVLVSLIPVGVFVD